MVLKYRRFGAGVFSAAFAGTAVLGSPSLPVRAATAAQIVPGAEGAIGVNNTSPSGAAIEGTVSASGDTSLTIPFGVLGEYLASPTTFGIGAGGISTSGYAIGAEVFGANAALFSESKGSGAGLQLVTSANATALAITAKSGTALQIEGTGTYGLQATSLSGTALQATSTLNAAQIDSSGGGSTVLGDLNGIGVMALGTDNTSAERPALLAQSNTQIADVFDGYNSHGLDVFQIENGTRGLSGVGPATGSDVNMMGDLYVTGGLYECLQNDGGCSTIGAADPNVPDTKTRSGAHVRTFGARSAAATLEDFGEGRLSNGSALVRLDPVVSDALHGTDSYAVFLTPGGESRGLYFFNRTPQGFEVRETGGGRSNLSFAYRIVATRASAAQTRPPLTLSKAFPQPSRPASTLRVAEPGPQIAATRPIPEGFRALLQRDAAVSSRKRAASSTGSATQVTGSEGAVAYNNPSTSGSAVEGTVSSSGNTSFTIPFGVLGDYFDSNSTFGAGVIGTSVSGYGVGAEAFGGSVAILGLGNGNPGLGMQIVTTSTGQGIQISSAGAGITAATTGAGNGVFDEVTAQDAIYATSTNATAATLTSTSTIANGGGSGGQAVLGSANGTGIAAHGYDNDSNHQPALLAEAEYQNDIFEGYNAASPNAVFQIRGKTNNASGMVPSNGTDVSIYGDFYVTGGIYQCTDGLQGSNGGTCTAVTQSASTSAQRQSEPTVEDFGEAKLSAGSTYVALDPKFSDAIASPSYLVFLTSEGDAGNLYFANRTLGGFTVRESGGGRSNAAFSYRIVAKPAGVAAARFPTVALTRGPQPKPRIAGLQGTPHREKPLVIHVRHLGVRK